MDREKVIKALECCQLDVNKCLDCPYLDKQNKVAECGIELHRDAIALLKAQEPRVMTLEEAKSAYVIEYRSGKMREVGAALLDIDVDPLNAEYGKVYRVWTSRPTEAQREATPWRS